MASTSSPIRLLHVDDDADYAALVSTFLQREDARFDVESASDAAEGLARLSDAAFDCVVSDYDMPGRNGIEFLDAVRESYPELPFILFTGKGSEEVASDAISAGVTDYLQKGSGTDRYVVLANRVRNAVERRHAERDAETSRTRLEAITDGSNDAIVAVDCEGRIEFANPAVEALFGYDPSALLGESVTTLLPSGGETDGLSSSLRAGSPAEWSGVERSARHRDGHDVRVAVSVSEFRQDGERRFVVVLRDVTEEHHLTEALRRRTEQLHSTEARYRSIIEDVFDAFPVGLFILDDDFEVVWINEATERYFGLDRATVVGSNKRHLIDERIKDRFEDPERFAETVLATYDDNTYAEQFRCHVLPGPDREERWLEHWSQPITEGIYAGGRIENYVDITERCLREQALQRQNARLDEFASIVSHDLRNPLTVASGYLELASDDCDSPHLEPALSAVERSQTLVSDLLDLATTGREIGDMEPVELADTVSACWRNVATAEATLVIDTDLTVRADASRLRQLFENLFRNAVDHGGPDVTVTVGDLSDGSGFYVADDGPGVPEGARDGVFEAGHTTTTDGTGFGLAIVSRIAEAHGWTVSLADAAAGGARFEVSGIDRLT